MSKLKGPIDYKKLEMELQQALKEDELYKLQNDAKLRAVEQKVPTYEHFRQMVNGAHLKPLERKDIESKAGSSWNPVIVNSNLDPTEPYDLTKGKINKDVDSVVKTRIPQTYKEFAQTWERIETYATKFDYLLNIKDLLQQTIFQAEIPPILFNELLHVCLQKVATTNNVRPVIEILQILSTCKRFQLAVTFMGEEERSICSRLFHELLVKVGYQDGFVKNIEYLAATYGVTNLITAY